MKKQVIIFGSLMALLILVLKLIEYNYLVKNFTQELVIGIIAFLFTTIGIWFGANAVHKKSSSTIKKVFENTHNLTHREIEVLKGISEGLSNKEIGEKLFLSESTIKTHSTNLFSKLNVNRRTQAILKAQKMGIVS